MKVLIVYGSTTGNTEAVAQMIETHIAHDVNVVDVSEVSTEAIKEVDLVIFGASTWDLGGIQEDFEAFMKQHFSANLLEGKNVAVFGCGDSESYPDDFALATNQIVEEAKKHGANIIGEALKVDGDIEDNEEAIIEFALQF